MYIDSFLVMGDPHGREYIACGSNKVIIILIMYYFVDREGEICFARYVEDDSDEDPLWYRGQCIGQNDDEASILFVDFGNTCTLTPNDLRPAPDQFYTQIITGTIQLAGM